MSGDPRWAGWGATDAIVTLPEPVLRLLHQVLGVSGPAVPSVDPAHLPIPGSVLPEQVRAELTAVLGAGALRTDPASRAWHTLGCSTPDLVRLRAGALEGVPDAVALPATHDDVVAVLRLCSAHRVAVVPRGGGTSVVGGLAGHRASHAALLAMDLRRLDRLLEVDLESRVAYFEAGVRAPQAEALLAPYGLMLGHYPQSYEYATLGGFAATRSAGQASAGYGRFDEMVTRLRVATPVGTLDLGRAPASAAGPDLRQLVLGSEGTLGVVTTLGVRVRPLPEARRYEGWRFPDFASGLTAVRGLAQGGPLPTVLRLSDEAETAVGLADPDQLGAGVGPGGCLLVLGHEGPATAVRRERAALAGRLRAAGGTELGTAPGEAWRAGRYRAPYLRDALLDAGVFVETLETAAFWSRLPALYAAVRAAVTDTLAADGAPSLVLGHVSHVYPTGASLYFTVACAPGADPLGRWARAKAAASEAIVAVGGTISHHHGVGVDHAPWYAAEVGPLGVAVVRAVKAVLDPQGILNPGVLVG
ncbi:MAG: FAD-binding oxidoreductase [Actinomycetota bacterium]